VYFRSLAKRCRWFCTSLIKTDTWYFSHVAIYLANRDYEYYFT